MNEARRRRKRAEREVNELNGNKCTLNPSTRMSKQKPPKSRIMMTMMIIMMMPMMMMICLYNKQKTKTTSFHIYNQSFISHIYTGSPFNLTDSRHFPLNLPFETPCHALLHLDTFPTYLTPPTGGTSAFYYFLTSDKQKIPRLNPHTF